jgi:tRNA-specific 2-thiouridylase
MTLYVEPDSEHIMLYSDEAVIEDVIFRGVKKNGHYTAKFRYRQEDQNIELMFLENNTARVFYPHGVKAVTPGQLCAIYDGDICLGAGFIQTVYYKGNKRIYA